MSESNHYYNLLNREQKQAYHAIRTGLEALAPSFSVPRLSGAEFADIFFCLRLDHPALFYCPRYSYRFYQQAESVEFIPEYLFPKAKVMDHKAAMAARLKKLARPAMQLSPEEKLLYIHDFICRNVRYDKLKKAYSHEIIGPLGQGVGVCEGIAKAVKLLCDELGIWCIIAISGNNPEKGIKYRHAWNIVRLNGKYYHLDATFDNSLGRGELIRYDYFLQNDAQIFRDHEPVLWPVPECADGARAYYREKKLSFTKYEDVRKRAAQAVRKGKPLIFHWRGGYLTREVAVELLRIFEEEGAKKGLHPALSLNWPQAVLCVRFEKEALADAITTEEANEGERYDGEVND